MGVLVWMEGYIMVEMGRNEQNDFISKRNTRSATSIDKDRILTFPTSSLRFSISAPPRHRNPQRHLSPAQHSPSQPDQLAPGGPI